MVDAWWYGLGVLKIMSEVVGEAVTSTDMVWNEGSKHKIVESKTVDKGEGNFEEVGEVHVWMFFLDGAPNLGCCLIFVAPSDVEPQVEEDVAC